MVFKMRPFSLPKPRSQEHLSTVRKFSWTELQLATDNFSVHNVVGRGGFGGVYKGMLPDGSVVVVKRHAKNTNNSLGDAQFKAEVQVGECEASDHGNVIRLLGYCRTTRERLLVYPFMVNGSLASRLWKRPPSQPPLDWASRIQIALGAAKGLAHLHSSSSFPVIHRDIKPDNILLDDQFEAVLCDFGLAKFVGRKGNESNTCWVSSSSEEEYGDDNGFEEEESDEDKSGFTKSCWNFTRTFMLKSEDHKADFLELFPHVSTRVMGTMGYADPEYVATGRCSIKSDVYGHGIILLELISGRRGIDHDRQHKDNTYLSQWVKRLVAAKKSHLVVDPDLKGGFTKKEMKQVLQLALLCTSNTPQERPEMSEVIIKIENICTLQPHGQIVGGSFVHRFSLPELELATHNFSNNNTISVSSFNRIYQGVLQDDGSPVVVKRLINRSKQGMMQFHAEVNMGGIIRGKHPNLLQLCGYYVSGKERLLVYPFMANRSLEQRLRPDHSLPLSWPVRKKIALGVARGVVDLHHFCDSCTNINIHCDMPSNILLDIYLNPVLSNLRLQYKSSSQVNLVVSSHKYDVYRYGVTLLVLLAGQRVIDLISREANNHDRSFANSGLYNWCKNKLTCHQLHLLYDPRLVTADSNCDTEKVKKEIEQLIQVALLCMQPFPMNRPEMSEVIQMVQGIILGDLQVCFAFDHAKLFQFHDPPQSELPREFEEDSPQLDIEGPVSSELHQPIEVQHSLKSTLQIMSAHQVDPGEKTTNSSNLPVNLKQKTIISSEDKEVVSFKVKPTYSSTEGITIMGNVWEDQWQLFATDVVTDAQPTKSNRCQSGMTTSPLCPFCNEYEEDNFHFLFECDFPKQVWQSARQLTQESQPLTQQELANGPGPDATSDTTGCVSIASDHVNCIQFKSSHDIEHIQLQPEPSLLPLVSEPVANNKQYDFHVDITSAGFSLSLKIDKLSVMWIILLTSLCMNFVLIWR